MTKTGNRGMTKDKIGSGTEESGQGTNSGIKCKNRGNWLIGGQNRGLEQDSGQIDQGRMKWEARIGVGETKIEEGTKFSVSETNRRRGRQRRKSGTEESGKTKNRGREVKKQRWGKRIKSGRMNHRRPGPHVNDKKAILLTRGTERVKIAIFLAKIRFLDPSKGKWEMKRKIGNFFVLFRH